MLEGDDARAAAGVVWQARDRARRIGAPVLAAIVRPAPADREAAAMWINGARPGDYAVYWSAPHAAETFLALGALKVVRADGDDRFTSARAGLREVLDTAVVGVAPGAPAVRPRAFGGFAFSAAASDDERWRNFSAAEFAVHRTVYGVAGERGWIMRCTLVSPGADVDTEAARLLSYEGPEAAAPLSGLTLQRREPGTRASFVARVDAALDAIAAGGLRKVVVARSATYDAQGALNPALTIDRMHEAFAQCTVFWFGSPRAGAFIGATPERLLRHTDGTLETMALAGSAARGADDGDDDRRADALQHSEKDLAEHEFVVASIRETLAGVASDVRVADAPGVLRLANIAHLRTPITAHASDADAAFAALAALHPTPAVGGVPRDAARAFLDRTEGGGRGWYAGPIGWIDASGDFDFAVALRSAMVREHEVSLFAGAGVVAGSRPEQELAETELKMDAMRRVLGDDRD